jgi:hypothetical protein
MIWDYSRVRVDMTRHAVDEAKKDGIKIVDIKKSLGKIVEFEEFEENKKRGIIRVGAGYCTLIYVKKKRGLLLITCWKSNREDIREYRRCVDD